LIPRFVKEGGKYKIPNFINGLFLNCNLKRIFATILIGNMDKKTQEFYERLRLELNTSTDEWPLQYLFKFIVPSEDEKIEAVENAFNDLGAVINTKRSKTGKYTSISIDVPMQNAQEIIDQYLKVSTIEGIISL
jgi:putative lipoic acid-binding regulatory protein